MTQKNILLLFSLLFYQLLFAQNKTELPDKTGVWILDKTVSNVDFYHMIKVCSGNKVAFLKFNNRNNFTVVVNWKESFSTQLEEGIFGAKGQKHLQLPPGEFAYADCNTSRKEFMITPAEVSAAYVAIINRFAYNDIMVERVK
jgi:hypothetical protein